MSISMNKNNMQEFRYVCIFICSVYEYGYERLWMYEFINVWMYDEYINMWMYNRI